MPNDQAKKVNKDLLSLKEEIDLLWNWLIELKEPGNTRRVPAFWNIVTYGRMVTFHMQKILKGANEFEEWYSVKQKEMENDDLLKFFKELRNRIEKEKLVRPSNVTYISHLEFPKDLNKLGPPPPGAKGFFIGDEYGGSGWNVEGPNGKLFKMYVNLPSDIGSTWMTLENIPHKHKDKEIDDDSLESICTLYIDYLNGLVEEAIDRFMVK